MQRLPYKDFSLKFHQKRWQKNRPNLCQLELTFKCPLHCQHCYTDCYNTPKDLKKELNTQEIFQILDKVYNSGIFWLCFTGGDPLTRADFLEIYTYAKKMGFIISVFTSGVLITEKIADFFKQLTPFCIELTLNGITQKTYEAISNVKGSYELVMSAIKKLKERKIPFQIKTQMTRQNYQELKEIKDFIESLGLRFRPDSIVSPRLNQDLTPCRLRLKPKEILEINGRFKAKLLDNEEMLQVFTCSAGKTGHKPEVNENLFRCASGSDIFHIDPYGNMFLCSLLRKPLINILKKEITDGFRLFRKIKAKRFKTESKCRTCSISYLCHRCPGEAFLEVGDMEAPVDYFCKLAHLVAQKRYV